jgi:hypothetical protein
MSQKSNGRVPISDEELCGLIMAMVSEAVTAGWNIQYGIKSNGSLVMQMSRDGFEFVNLDGDNGRQLGVVSKAAVTEESSHEL